MHFDNLWTHIYGIGGLFVMIVWSLLFPLWKKKWGLNKEKKDQEYKNITKNLSQSTDSSRNVFFLQGLIGNAMYAILWSIWGCLWIIIGLFSRIEPFSLLSFIHMLIIGMASFKCTRHVFLFHLSVRRYFRFYYETNPDEVVPPANGADSKRDVLNDSKIHDH